MTVEIRPAVAEEMEEFRRLDRYAFAGAEPAEDDDTPDPMRPEFTLCAFVDGKLATTFGSFPFRVNIAGAEIRMAGVTAVATWPGFRRRGLLRQVMTESFVRQRERGRQPFAILWASFGAIYQRFGYGPASHHLTYRFDPTELQLLDRTPGAGVVEVLKPKDVVEELKPVFDVFMADRPMALQRQDIGWMIRLGNPVSQHVAVHRVDGTATGYAIFQMKRVDRDEVGPDQELTLTDFAYVDAEAHRGLWQFFGAHDLACRIQSSFLPTDDPLLLAVEEPRNLRAQVWDGLWMRVVDVESALAERPTAGHGVVSFAVRDELCAWNAGTYTVEAADGERAVTRSTADADITLDVHALAPLLAGHRTASQLAAAGMLDADPASLLVADRLYRTNKAPFCADVF